LCTWSDHASSALRSSRSPGVRRSNFLSSLSKQGPHCPVTSSAFLSVGQYNCDSYVNSCADTSPLLFSVRASLVLIESVQNASYPESHVPQRLIKSRQWRIGGWESHDKHAGRQGRTSNWASDCSVAPLIATTSMPSPRRTP